jgi:hypothetical protein
MDLEDDKYVVEHDDNFVLDKEQLRKLIEAKFKRNNVLHRLNKERESGLKHAND